MTPRVEADTPLMQQYREIKARHPDTILFFRMGDFYEMFEDDAQLAARELGLTLTSRNNGGAADVPLAGVPVKAATEYLRRLIGLGHRVAICEQVEDPKLAKGLVRRAVVETVTPGTVLADDWLERTRNNFLLAVDARGAPAGLAALDLTTGELLLETVAPEDLAAALARYEPREVVLPGGTPAGVPLPGAVRTEREAWEFDPELARDDLARTFRVASVDGLGVEPGDRPALGAVGALLRYARELTPGGLPQLARPRVLRRGDRLPLDEMTRRNLELVEPLRAVPPAPSALPGGAGTTLLAVLDRTMTPMGARLLRGWLLAPLVDPGAITARLDAVEVLASDVRGRDRLREALDGVRDVERLAGRAALGRGPRASWGRCGIRFSVCPTCAPRSTAWKRAGGPRSSRTPRTDSISSRTWATSSPGRWWIVRRPRRRMATRFGPATITSSTSSRTRATAGSSTSPGSRHGSASAPASPHSRSGSTRSSATTSRSRTHTGTVCRPTTSGARRYPAPSGSSRPSSRRTRPRCSVRRSESRRARRSWWTPCAPAWPRRSPGCRLRPACSPGSTCGAPSPMSRSARGTCDPRSTTASPSCSRAAAIRWSSV